MTRKPKSGPGKKAAKKTTAAKASARRTRPARRATEQVFEGLAVSPGVALGPCDGKPFFFEQPLVVGDQLAQPLERGGRFQHQLFHGGLPLTARREPAG